MENRLKWVSSTGGPLVLIHTQYLNKWFGVYSFTTEENKIEIYLEGGGLVLEEDFLNPQKTHYGKACEYPNLCGIIDFDDKQVIVLGDEPATTAWFPYPDEEGGIFLRWIFAPDEESMLKSLNGIPNKGWEKNGIFNAKSSSFKLIDSSCPGIDVEENESLAITLNPGNYDLATLEYQPDVSTHLRLHKLEKHRRG
ncbi:Imm21 family immunity protein [Nostoc sp. C117]|uniref:Imm21 family immunity protein n=1 Tax=Nostoc sp. C117 TaxID=3349875 RepID=UPI00370D70F5